MTIYGLVCFLMAMHAILCWGSSLFYLLKGDAVAALAWAGVLSVTLLAALFMVKR